MKSRQLKLLSSAGAIAMILATANANATLEYLGPVDLTGTGLGNVNTLLTIQSPANTTTESGSVSWNGSSNVTTGDTQAINNTLSLSSLGTSASDLRIIFNPVEPGNAAANSITLDNLVATIYSPTGDALWNSGTFNSVTFPTTETGTGRAGFSFGLDATQAAQAQTFFDGANRLGLAATALDATGGHETFFATTAQASPVPEPETYGMLLAGLGLVGFVSRRRRTK
jgi:hypothetical protein